MNKDNDKTMTSRALKNKRRFAALNNEFNLPERYEELVIKGLAFDKFDGAQEVLIQSKSDQDRCHFVPGVHEFMTKRDVLKRRWRTSDGEFLSAWETRTQLSRMVGKGRYVSELGRFTIGRARAIKNKRLLSPDERGGYFDIDLPVTPSLIGLPRDGRSQRALLVGEGMIKVNGLSHVPGCGPTEVPVELLLIRAVCNGETYGSPAMVWVYDLSEILVAKGGEG